MLKQVLTISTILLFSLGATITGGTLTGTGVNISGGLSFTITRDDTALSGQSNPFPAGAIFQVIDTVAYDGVSFLEDDCTTSAPCMRDLRCVWDFDENGTDHAFGAFDDMPIDRVVGPPIGGHVWISAGTKTITASCYCAHPTKCGDGTDAMITETTTYVVDDPETVYPAADRICLSNDAVPTWPAECDCPSVSDCRVSRSTIADTDFVQGEWTILANADTFTHSGTIAVEDWVSGEPVYLSSSTDGRATIETTSYNINGIRLHDADIAGDAADGMRITDITFNGTGTPGASGAPAIQIADHREVTDFHMYDVDITGSHFQALQNSGAGPGDGHYVRDMVYTMGNHGTTGDASNGTCTFMNIDHQLWIDTDFGGHTSNHDEYGCEYSFRTHAHDRSIWKGNNFGRGYSGATFKGSVTIRGLGNQVERMWAFIGNEMNVGVVNASFKNIPLQIFSTSGNPMQNESFWLEQNRVTGTSCNLPNECSWGLLVKLSGANATYAYNFFDGRFVGNSGAERSQFRMQHDATEWPTAALPDEINVYGNVLWDSTAYGGARDLNIFYDSVPASQDPDDDVYEYVVGNVIWVDDSADGTAVIGIADGAGGEPFVSENHMLDAGASDLQGDIDPLHGQSGAGYNLALAVTPSYADVRVGRTDTGANTTAVEALDHDDTPSWLLMDARGYRCPLTNREPGLICEDGTDPIP